MPRLLFILTVSVMAFCSSVQAGSPAASSGYASSSYIAAAQAREAEAVNHAVERLEKLAIELRDQDLYSGPAEVRIRRTVAGLPHDVKQHPAVITAAAVVGLDRSVDPEKQLRRLLVQHPQFWPAWRVRVTARLALGRGAQAAGTLRQFQAAVVDASCDSQADHSALVAEIAWIRDVAGQMADSGTISRAIAHNLQHDPAAGRLMASPAARQILAASRTYRTVSNADLRQRRQMAQAKQLGVVNEQLNEIVSDLNQVWAQGMDAIGFEADRFSELNAVSVEGQQLARDIEQDVRESERMSRQRVCVKDDNFARRAAEKVVATVVLPEQRRLLCDVNLLNTSILAEMRNGSRRAAWVQGRLASVVADAQNKLARMEADFGTTIRTDATTAGRVKELKSRFAAAWQYLPFPSQKPGAVRSYAARRNSTRQTIQEVGLDMETAFRLLRRTTI